VAKVLVVGGAGYVGGWITDRLLAEGHQARVYDCLLYEDVYLKPVDFVYGDVLDHARLAPQLEWADSVVWLAALVGDGACSLDADLTRQINVGSLRWLVAHYDGRIVFMSTCSVYGAMDGVLTEQSATSPLSLYAETKLQAESILAPADAICFRLGTLFGLGDQFSRIRLDLVANTLTVKALLYKRVSVYGGEQWRPLLHVRDVAEAVVANVTSAHRGIFNLHTVNLKISDIAGEVCRQVPDVTVQRGNIRFQDARNYRVCSDLARQTFGFAPNRSLAEGISEIRRLVEQGRIRDVSSPRYTNADFLRPRLAAEKNSLGYEVATGRWLR